MNKYLVVILIILGLISCTTKDEHYYRSNPKALQAALKVCPNQQPSGVSCQQLEQLMERMTRLAYQLQMSPQGFGHKILDLQQAIATQQQQLAQNNNPELSVSLEQNQQQLADYLAVVKWLESPES